MYQENSGFQEEVFHIDESFQNEKVLKFPTCINNELKISFTSKLRNFPDFFPNKKPEKLKFNK